MKRWLHAIGEQAEFIFSETVSKTLQHQVQLAQFTSGRSNSAREKQEWSRENPVEGVGKEKGRQP
jgi:hypothetical protein